MILEATRLLPRDGGGVAGSQKRGGEEEQEDEDSGNAKDSKSEKWKLRRHDHHLRVGGKTTHTCQP